MLRIANLVKNFDSKEKQFVAVKHVNLDVKDGEFVSIIGYSGSGKSTLLNLISGLLKPTEGCIELDNMRINNFSDEKMSVLRNGSIGYVLQGNSLLSNLTVEENILLPLTFSQKNILCDVESIMGKLGISDLKNKYPAEISGGEAKRCAIARTVLLNPRLLLADEPVSDLDPENTKIIMEAFREYASNGMSIIMVTHNMDTIKYSDTVYRMHNGALEKGDGLA